MFNTKNSVYWSWRLVPSQYSTNMYSMSGMNDTTIKSTYVTWTLGTMVFCIAEVSEDTASLKVTALS